MLSSQQDLGMNGHVVGHLLNIAKTCPAHHLHQLLRGSQAPCPHGQQIKMKVGICLGRYISTTRGALGHGLSQK